MKTLISSVCFVALAGCVNSRTPEQLKDDSVYYLLNEYHREHVVESDDAADLETEMRRRGLFAESEWAMVKAHRVELGASKVAVLASWGQPDRTEARTSQSVTLETWIYDYELVRQRGGEERRWPKRACIGFQDDKVVSIEH